MYNDSLSPADVAVLSGNNGGNNGFGNGDWSAWIIIFLIFALGGFGRNGFGGYGGNGGGNDGGYGYGFGWNPCCAPATQQGLSDAFNFNNLDNNVRGVQQGLCDGFYAVNTSILNLGQSLLNCCCDLGFKISENGWQTRDAINTNSNAIQGQLCNGFNGINQNINNLGYKLQDCCCETQRAIDGVNYNMAKNTCDIIRAGQDNTQRIIDYLTSNEITSLRTELQSAQLQLSQLSQTRTLIDEIKPCPQPAYLTCNPYAPFYGYGNAGFNNGCNANCGCC